MKEIAFSRSALAELMNGKQEIVVHADDGKHYKIPARLPKGFGRNTRPKRSGKAK